MTPDNQEYSQPISYAELIAEHVRLGKENPLYQEAKNLFDKSIKQVLEKLIITGMLRPEGADTLPHFTALNIIKYFEHPTDISFQHLKIEHINTPQKPIENAGLMISDKVLRTTVDISQIGYRTFLRFYPPKEKDDRLYKYMYDRRDDDGTGNFGIQKEIS